MKILMAAEGTGSGGAAAPAAEGDGVAPTTLGTPAPAAPAGAPNPGPTNSYPETDWRHKLPDDFREESSLKNMNDPVTAAKALVHAQRMLGFEKVAKPGPHATEEDWQKFYDSVGRPPLPEYKVNAPKEAKFVDPKLVEKLTPLAHKLGVFPKQLEGILSTLEEESSSNFKAHQEAFTKKIADGISGLKTEWGQTFQQKTQWAARVIREDMGKEGVEFMNAHPEIGENPILIKFFAKLGEERWKEDKVVGEGVAHGMYTPAEAQSRANQILADTAHPYNNPEHPNHKASVAEVQNLWTMVYPDQKGA